MPGALGKAASMHLAIKKVRTTPGNPTVLLGVLARRFWGGDADLLLISLDRHLTIWVQAEAAVLGCSCQLPDERYTGTFRIPIRLSEMHPAAKLLFERVIREYSQWRAVPEEERSPAPAWWWQPAIEVMKQSETMTVVSCHRLELPEGSTYAAGASVLMAPILTQASQPWADEFPRKHK
jgi:hypothetical protein